MAQAKAKSKSPAKTATKAKATKAKVAKTQRTKTKSPTKKVAKTKTPKKKVTAKKTHAKSAKKAAHPHKAPAKVTRKKKVGKAVKAEKTFTPSQQEELILLVESIISLRKGESTGLRSYERIDRILNHYNQQFTDPHEKLAAIIKYGVEKTANLHAEHVYVSVIPRAKDEVEFYKILNDIAHDKVNFHDAKEKMIHVYETARGQTKDS